jgi:hypothetical protein
MSSRGAFIANHRATRSWLLAWHGAAALLLLAFPLRLASAAPDAIAAEAFRLPEVGEHALRILSPRVLELTLVTSRDPGSPGASKWEIAENGSHIEGGLPGDYLVLVDSDPRAVKAVGARRRVLYAASEHRDLRVDNHRFLVLAEPFDLSKEVTIEVRNPSGQLWAAEEKFIATTSPLRLSPAIHVNEVGYTPALPKKAMVGYYLGNLGELLIPSEEFQLVENETGKTVFTGKLSSRKDVGFLYEPTPYQNVREADFSTFDRPGKYRVVVPGLGASLPFRIDDGSLMAFVRTYALGLYHQRCGTDNALPFTRFVHEACHTAPAAVPLPEPEFEAAWKIIANLNKSVPVGQSGTIRDASSQLYPYINRGPVDVSGGHHDAGDYSKYTTNSAALIHTLIFAVDSLPGVAELDNLGIPASGDGISDILQEAKWEADFLAKMQDADGGFYFLVYPRDRRYEGDVPPDHGDPQIVWPKNTAVTAAATAALAQCASSPLFKKHFPKEATVYLEKAKLGWKFLADAIARHGKAGAYQKLTHYSDNWTHDDEIAWAACELFLATGDSAFQRKLFEWFPDPADTSTWRWGWWRMSECWGNAIRSYAFASRNGRVPREKLDAKFLSKCEIEVVAAGDDAASRSRDNAYGTSFAAESKKERSAGWYFSNDLAFDITVAYQLDPRDEFRDAVLANLNFEAGCNPSNVSFIAGLGWKRPREIVHQFARTDRRTLAPSGIPLGNLQSEYQYLDLYKSELGSLSFPDDGQNPWSYPLYDRWADTFNVTTEAITVNIARSLASLAYFAARTPSGHSPWTFQKIVIAPLDGVVPVGEMRELHFAEPPPDLEDAVVVWEARDHEPVLGPSMRFTAKSAGAQWAEVEVQWPDGRRAFANLSFSADAPVTRWIDGTLPKGATAGTNGGDAWRWAAAERALPLSDVAQVHVSTSSPGLHEHWFEKAEATLDILPGDTLFAYVYLDPSNPPKEVMLMWNDGTWEHRAYWGENQISYGTTDSAGRHPMGAIPATGEWVRLEVPASAVALEGRTIHGMGFSLFDGRATWGPAGRLSGALRSNAER